MDTKIGVIETEGMNLVIREASKLIKSGEVVAFPTETVYGLGANALDPTAVAKIFEAKGRPSDNPLIVHISNLSQLDNIVEFVSDTAKRLMDEFWPGALTLVLPKKSNVPNITTAGLDSVGVRMPSHRVAAALIDACGCPLAAPSANSFSRPSPTLAEHVYHDLNGKIPYIVDGGACDIGLESTIARVDDSKVTILRPGGVSIDDIKRVCGDVILHPAVSDPKSKVDLALAPGMKYRHYSPSVEVILVDKGRVEDIISENSGKKICLLTLSDRDYDVEVLNYSSVSELGKNIFKVFREYEAKGYDLIIVDKILHEGLGVGLLNRVKKAASKVV